MVKAIFFDFDGVIVESTDIKTAAFSQLFAHEGPAVSQKVTEYHLMNAGVSRFDKFRHIYRAILGRPLGDDEFRILCDKFSKLVMDAVIKAPFVKGAKEFISKFHTSVKFYLITATPQGEIENILHQRSLKTYFHEICGAPLPKSNAVKQILEKYTLMPNDALYIGDAMSDYQAALDNNVTFIARIHEDDSLFDNSKCMKINDLTSLEQLISS